MKMTGHGVISVLVLAAVATITTGCSHDTLSSGSEALAVRYVPSPSGSGRFDLARFSITKLLVLPADPDTLAIYGNNQLSLSFDPFTAELTLTEPVTFSQIALSAGTYDVTTIEFTSPLLVDTNPISNPATCYDAVSNYPSPPASSQVPLLTTFTRPPSLRFTVRPGQSNLSLTVDVPGLIAGYEGAFTCSTTDPRCGGGPCLTGFDQNAYRNALLANIALE